MSTAVSGSWADGLSPLPDSVAFVKPATQSVKGRVATVVPAAGSAKAATPTAQELQDLANLADQNGMSLEEATTKYAWRDNLGIVIDHLRYANLSSFVESAMDENGGRISFTGDAPADAAAKIAAAGLPVPVQIRDQVGYNEKEIVAATQRLFHTVLDDPMLASSASADPGAEAGQIRIMVRPAVGVTVDEAKARISAAATSDTPLKDALADVPPAVEAVISIDTTITAETAVSVYGGQQLRPFGSPDWHCTTGFTVQRAAPPHERGVLSAGHCGDGTYGGVDILQLHARRFPGNEGDIQWHKVIPTSNPVTNRFFWINGSNRVQTGRIDPQPGMSVCRYGLASGVHCNEVYKVGHCFDYPEGQTCGLTLMHRSTDIGGDSGGPYYWDSVAYGVHSGHGGVNGFTRSGFTPAKWGFANVGAALLVVL